MTYNELSKDYPNVCEEFDRYFKREGWGANDASELSEYGFNEWFPDFIRDYEIVSISEYELELSKN